VVVEAAQMLVVLEVLEVVVLGQPLELELQAELLTQEVVEVVMVAQAHLVQVALVSLLSDTQIPTQQPLQLQAHQP
jgi:hypothetical protein